MAGEAKDILEWCSYVGSPAINLETHIGFRQSSSADLECIRSLRCLVCCYDMVQGMGLPADDLCLENAVVLERFSHRFPLVVDPAGQATRFLLNKYKVGFHRRPMSIF